jgi:hypothetical protein
MFLKSLELKSHARIDFAAMKFGCKEEKEEEEEEDEEEKEKKKI